jgi:hypothetical protein
VRAIALTILSMMLLQILIQAAFDWIRDLLAELLGRCIGAFVAKRRARKGKGHQRETSEEPTPTETDR